MEHLFFAYPRKKERLETEPIKVNNPSSEMGDVAAVSGQLATAVELMMNPAVPQLQRQQAFQQLEEFKVRFYLILSILIIL